MKQSSRACSFVGLQMAMSARADRLQFGRASLSILRDFRQGTSQLQNASRMSDANPTKLTRGSIVS